MEPRIWNMVQQFYCFTAKTVLEISNIQIQYYELITINKKHFKFIVYCVRVTSISFLLCFLVTSPLVQCTFRHTLNSINSHACLIPIFYSVYNISYGSVYYSFLSVVPRLSYFGNVHSREHARSQLFIQFLWRYTHVFLLSYDSRFSIKTEPFPTLEGTWSSSFAFLAYLSTIPKRTVLFSP